MNMLCEICGIDCGPYDVVIYRRNLEQERSFHQEFWAKKGVKKDANDSFDSCRECHKKFQDYYAEELIKELNQKSLAEVGIYPSCGKNSFSSEDYYEKFQKALTENVKHHSKEWKIIQVNCLEQQKKIKKTLLIYKSAKIEYEGDILKDESFNEPKKMYWRDFLPVSSEQWKEIETKISSEQKQNSQSSKNTGIVSEIIIVSGIIFFLSFLFYLVAVKRKNQKI